MEEAWSFMSECYVTKMCGDQLECDIPLHRAWGGSKCQFFHYVLFLNDP